MAKYSKVRKVFTLKSWVIPVRSLFSPTITPSEVISTAQTIWLDSG